MAQRTETTTISGTPADSPKPASMRARAISGTKWTMIGFAISTGLRFAGNVVCGWILGTAAAFGVMQIANAILQGVTMLSDVGIGPSIIQNKRGNESRFLNTAWTVQVIRGVLMWLVMLGLAYPLATLYNEDSLLYIIPLIGVSALLGGFNATAIFTLNKRLDVRSLTLMTLGSQIAGVGAMIAVAWWTRDVIALAVVGVVQAVVRLYVSHRLDPKHRNRFEWDRSSLRELLGFGSVVFISTALTYLGQNGDRLILGKQVSMEQLGLYGVALMIARLPLDVVLNIGTGVAFPAYSHAFNSGQNFPSVFKRVRFPLCVAGAFAMAGVAICGPELVKLLWTEPFHEAADYIPLLCVGALFQMLEITSGSALLAMGKVKYLAIGNALRVVTLFAGLFIGYQLNGFWGAMIGMVIADAVRYFTSAFFARREGLPIFGHDLLLYLLTVVAYFAAFSVQQHLPDLATRALTLIEHIIVDGLVVSAFFAWPLYIVAKEFLSKPPAPRPLVESADSMRITFVMPPLGMQGGIRVVADYARYLQARGHSVTVVTPELRNRPIVQRIRAFIKGLLFGGGLAPAAGTHNSPRPASHFDSTSVPVTYLRGERTVTPLDVPDADIVIATWWETAEWVSEFPPSKGVQAYFVQGYEVWKGQPTERVELTYRTPLRKITISNWLRRVLSERYGDSNTLLVPNGVDLARFTTQPRGKQPRPTVGFIHSDQSIKGVDLIIAAIAKARETIPDLHVVSFGAHALTGQNELPPGTVFTLKPSHERIVSAYASCDAWISASRSEGFGLPILEAMACRTPVIASPAGAASELLEPGGGFLVGHEDVEGLARSIIAIARLSDAEWRQLSDIAHATAQGYDGSIAAQKFEAALAHIVTGRPIDSSGSSTTPNGSP